MSSWLNPFQDFQVALADLEIEQAEAAAKQKSLTQSSNTNYIFSPDNWTVLQPELVTKSWNELNLNSNLDMYIEFDIQINTSYSNWRNLFHFTNNNQSSIRVPSMWVSPNDTFFSVCNSTEQSPWAYVATPSIGFNTATHVVITIYQGSVNTYFNSVLQNTQTIGGNYIQANSNTVLYISDPWYETDGGIQIKNLTFGNLSDSMKCSKDKICLGFEPDNRAYCYGSTEGCMWGQNTCNTNNDCINSYNITSPKYNGGGNDYCTAPLNTLSTSWPSGACPDIYQQLNNESCNYQMSNNELQCYQKNNPDLSGLTSSQLQENWSTTGCIEKRNNQCPSYQTNSGLYNYIGCYNDMCFNGGNGPRALPNYRGIVTSIDQCESIASSKNESLFGVQDGTSGSAQCFTGNDLESAKQYGLNVNRAKCAPLGGWCTQQIYQRTTPFPPPIQSAPILTTANFAQSVETFENRNNEKNNKLFLLIILFFLIGIVLFYIFKFYAFRKSIKFKNIK